MPVGQLIAFIAGADDANLYALPQEFVQPPFENTVIGAYFENRLQFRILELEVGPPATDVRNHDDFAAGLGNVFTHSDLKVAG